MGVVTPGSLLSRLPTMLLTTAEVVARLQSNPTGEAGLSRGAPAGLRFAPGAVQVLGD